jgi:hypothetical protein
VIRGCPGNRRKGDALTPSFFGFLASSRAAQIEPCARGARERRARRSSPMEETMIIEYARQLMDAHGQRAIAEAAQRAVESERMKDKDEAQTWRHVEAALKAMQGPIAS